MKEIFINRSGAKPPDIFRRNGSERKKKLAVYCSPRWKAVRLLMLGKYPICEALECTKLAYELDHKDGHVENWQENNLICLCKSCHSRKTFNGDKPIPLKERKNDN